MYVEGAGNRPEPMNLNVTGQVAEGAVHVLEIAARIAGYIITYEEEGRQSIENAAVAPKYQGQKFGARLMQFAEEETDRAARARLFLSTNVEMTENLE